MIKGALFQQEKSDIIFRNKITILSFICSCLVLWIHTYNLDTYGITKESSGLAHLAYIIESVLSNATQIAVPFFFAISGYLFFRTYELSKTISKWQTRLKSVVIPYICWCSIYYLYFAFLTNAPIVKDYVNASTVEFSICAWIRSLWESQYYTLWFLKELIIYIVIAPALFVLLKNRIIGIIILLFFIVNSYFGFVGWIPSGTVFYGLGAFLAINCRDKEKDNNLIFSFFGVVYIIFNLITGFYFVSDTLVKIVFISSCWFALDFIPLSKKLPWWMSITFFTYVFHDIILELIEKIVFVLLGNAPIFALLDYILVPALIIFLIIILAKGMKKFTPFLWGVLSGFR